MTWTVKVRAGSRVERAKHADLAEALAAVERRGRELERSADGRTVKVPLGRDYEPVQRVIGRIELSGPGRVRAGVDVRGDGSSECWTGRLRRELVEQRSGESAYDALRRTAQR
ncbi:MAG TPA: hypothetical protein VHF45_05015 [Thermoleophilaceae bacterium]|nr:hypothetical protein [Thermoleophilaceae bacterium]